MIVDSDPIRVLRRKSLCSSVSVVMVIENFYCNLYRYDANYSWLLSNITGNVFETCPKCMKNGICNDPHANPISSPLLCNQSETMRAYTNSEGFDPMYSPVPYVFPHSNLVELFQ